MKTGRPLITSGFKLTKGVVVAFEMLARRKRCPDTSSARGDVRDGLIR
jgi:hypothetical protein